MDYSEFIISISSNTPPNFDSQLLLAMWYSLKDEWDTSHEIVQDINSTDAAWVHAHLHKIEGDMSNAKYWYDKATKNTLDLSIEGEAEEIIKFLLS